LFDNNDVSVDLINKKTGGRLSGNDVAFGLFGIA